VFAALPEEAQGQADANSFARDMTPAINLTRERGSGAVRHQHPVYVDLLPPCNAACPANDGEPKQVIAKVSQETLAEMIGTTRSRVSHFMNKFRKMGFIDYNGHLEIRSSLLNVVLHDGPHISGDEAAPGERGRKVK
jgi:hypothetical protein